LLFLRNFQTQKSAGFSKAQNNSRAFGSLKILLTKKYSQPLLFAKISNVIANRTFPNDIIGVAKRSFAIEICNFDF